MAPGQGPVKIAAALAIAAAGLGGGFAYKKFRTYLSAKKLRKEREEQKAISAARKRRLKSGPARAKHPQPSRSENRPNRKLARTNCAHVAHDG